MTGSLTAHRPTARRELSSSIERVASVSGPLAARAAAELDSTLEAVARSRLGPRAWTASSLTATGFPVELAVSSTSPELRTVVEVVAPEADRRRALPAALELAAANGSRRWNDAAVALLADHLESFVPRFGAWLGSRHLEALSRHKVYVEVSPQPERAWALVDRLVPDARSIIGGVGPIRFVGLHLDRPDAIEVYVRPRLLGPDRLRICLTRAGLGDQAEPLLRAMGADEDRRRPRPVDGASLAVERGQVSAIAGFSFAHHRNGPDHRTRAVTLDVARRQHWPSARLYASLSEPLAAPRSPQQIPAAPIHTVLSDVAVAGSPTIHHHIGLAPLPTTTPTFETKGMEA